MKKSLYILAAAAIVAGCASNDLRNDVVKDAPIGFTKVYVENVTKAVYTNANFETAGNTFGVFGFKTTSKQNNARVFDNTKVTFQGGLNTADGYNATSDWAYSPLVYWDKTATEYNFFAYAPSDADYDWTAALTSNNPNTFSITGFKQATSQSTMIDLMTDLSTRNGSTNHVTGAAIGKNDVTFTFGHILSNINFKMAVSPALKSDETNNPVTVVSFELGKIKMNGSYAYVTDAYKWTLATGDDQNAADFSATLTSNGNVFDSKALKASNSEYTNVPGMTDLLFVPQSVDATYKVTIRYKINNEIYDKEILLSEFKSGTGDDATSLTSWVAGYQYIYQIVIGPNPILFDVETVSAWADGGTYTYTIQ